MKKINCIILFIITCLLNSNLNSQVTQEWVEYYNGPGNSNDNPHSMALDDSGNVFVAGKSGTQSSAFMSLVKYNPCGAEQWTARYYSVNFIETAANSVKTDRLGNGYMTGTAGVNSGNYQDVVTLKYNRNGEMMWSSSSNFGNSSAWEVI